MRGVRQPGLALEPRIVAVPCSAEPFSVMVPPGALLLDALAGAMAERGFESAALRFAGGALGPFAWLTPALSTDPARAAWYGGPWRTEGPCRIDAGALTLGWRESAPFFHAHALWTAPDGARAGGHLVPEETRAAEAVGLTGVGLVDARFVARPDPETGFMLFGPEATDKPAAPNARALRLRPNLDLTGALAAIARAAGWARAALHGGVGSIVGARFDGGAGDTDALATEMFATGTAVSAEGALLAIGLVDCDGRVAEGALVPGDNPVLMTFEGVLVRA